MLTPRRAAPPPPPTTRRRGLRASVATIATIAAVAGSVLLAGPASAHVTVDPDQAAPGGFTKLTFRVPTEAPKASTTSVSVSFPAGAPLASVSTKPHPGWTAKVTKSTLAKPIEDEGLKLTEAVSRITWTAREGAGIAPGQFDEFEVSVGPLPTTVRSLSFPTTQTYDDGTTVRWTDPVTAGGSEPEHPVPTLTPGSDSGSGSGSDSDSDSGQATATSGPSATAARATGAAAPSAPVAAAKATDGTARALGTAGLVLGLLGLLAGAAAFGAARRRGGA